MKRMNRMMMLLICLVASVSLSAQGLSGKDEKAINAQVKRFLGFMEAKNYSGTADLIYPKLFEHTPKDQLFQIFNLMEQAGIDLKFNDLKVTNMKALPQDEGIDYALIKFSMNLELPLNTDELKGYAALMVPMLQGNFGKENVDYNKKESYIKVTGERFLLGVNDPEYKEWLFLIYDDTFKSEIAKTIPAKINQAAAAATNE